jgi:hypothetical protein
MTLSNVVAAIVAVILVVVPCGLCVSMLVRGKFEASGYEIDWKTSPFGMAFTLVSFLSVPTIMIWGLLRQWENSSTIAPTPFVIYLECLPGDWPGFSFDGVGVQRELMITEEESGILRFSFGFLILQCCFRTASLGKSTEPMTFRSTEFLISMVRCHAPVRLAI